MLGDDKLKVIAIQHRNPKKKPQRLLGFARPCMMLQESLMGQRDSNGS